jgi:hypothetical protein
LAPAGGPRGKGIPGKAADGSRCATCGRSAFGVAGAGVSKGGASPWPTVIHWADGSLVTFGLEGNVGPGLLAYVEIAQADCLYNVWSNIDEDHLLGLLAGLRLVEPEAQNP